MIREYLDEIIYMLIIAIILAVIETIIFTVKMDKEKKDQYIRWFNIFGVLIILTIVFNELFDFFKELKYFLFRL